MGAQDTNTLRWLNVDSGAISDLSFHCMGKQISFFGENSKPTQSMWKDKARAQGI